MPRRWASSMTANGVGLSFTLIVFHISSGISILGPFIRFSFSRITSHALHVMKTQMIDERFIARPDHMAADMSKLVKAPLAPCETGSLQAGSGSRWGHVSPRKVRQGQ